MRITKKVLSIFLSLMMVFCLIPATIFAADKTEDCIYLSISYDGQYIDDKNGDPIVYLPVSMEDIAAVDLTEYGLENMLFDSDGDGDYETTALQLMIYAHEELYGGDWSDVNFDALPGSSYFRGGIFGFTENLVYFHNGDFPVDESQQSDYMTVGATSDRIVLEAGDFLDVASFECFSFLWDQQGGFHLFADEKGNYTHDYTIEKGKSLSVQLLHSFCDLMFGEAWVKEAADYEIFYGTDFGEADGNAFTNDNGFAEITFEEAGTYYLWCDGAMGSDDGTHGSCDYYMETGEPCIVSAPAYAKVVVTGQDEPVTPEAPREPQSVENILNATMAQLVETVTEPAFGTNAGEWTVFSVARGNHLSKDSQYFADYYDRIVETVNATAASVNLNGALHKTKSTDNSRLIVALSSIGKDSTSVGDWDLVEAYSANGFNWIKKQGINGTIWTLIALDSGNYKTSDPTIRQQCVNDILAAQHNDGGWSLVTAKAQPSNVDVTGMTLTALYPYRDQEAVADACETALAWLSESQLDNGGFPYGNGETSESCAWAIVAATTWGINPDTDPRFIKNGNSAIDNLLTYYVENEAMFQHQLGAGSNAMATDQAGYALVAYDRFINGKVGLYDYSDVTFDTSDDDTDVPDPPVTPDLPTDPEYINGEMTATLCLPENVNPGAKFNAIITMDDKWNNNDHYKLIDLIVNVPKGVKVTDVTAGSRLSGGTVSYELEVTADETTPNQLRIVYFDPNSANAEDQEIPDILLSGEEFPAELFTIAFELESNVAGGTVLNFGFSGMSLKLTSTSMVIVKTAVSNEGKVNVVVGITFSAVCLYTGDDIDLIPSTKKAVAVAVTGIQNGAQLTFKNGDTEIPFLWSHQITEKTGDADTDKPCISSYVALVDASIDMKKFVDAKNFVIGDVTDDYDIVFGDINGDTYVNAQDALAAVNFWLRKGNAPTDLQILTANVTGDSRLNTFDALGIVEAFVNDGDYGVVTKAATIAAAPAAAPAATTNNNTNNSTNTTNTGTTTTEPLTTITGTVGQ